MLNFFSLLKKSQTSQKIGNTANLVFVLGFLIVRLELYYQFCFAMSVKFLLIIVYIYFHWFLTAQFSGTCDQPPLSKILMVCDCILKLSNKFIHIWGRGTTPQLFFPLICPFLKILLRCSPKSEDPENRLYVCICISDQEDKVYIYILLLPRLFHKYLLKRLVVFFNIQAYCLYCKYC